MKSSKRFLSVVLSVILLLTTSGMTVFAEGVQTNEPTVVITEETTTEETSEEATTEEVTTEELSEEETTEETVTEEASTEEMATEEATTEEETTEETTTEEETTEETTEEAIFTGLPESYVLSSEEKASKADLAKHLDEIEDCVEGSEYVEDIVTCLTDSEEEAQAVATAFDGELVSYYKGLTVIELSEDKTVLQAVTAAADENTKLPAVWPEYIEYAFTDEGDAPLEETDPIIIEDEGTVSASAFNDPALKETSSNYQWQHAFVGDTYAWDAGYKGTGVTVAVIDSGLLKSHEDLSSNARDGKNYVDGALGTTSNVDGNGHGTHVSGIIGAQENNSKGGCGIAPDATLIGYRALGDDGSGRTTWTKTAILDAIDDGVDVINMSLGGYHYDGDYQQIINQAVEAGVAVFAAAGNEATNGFAYPASYDNVFSVAALQPSGSLTYFSNFTKTVDFAFPGYQIYSTHNSSSSGYTFMSGTSQATPVASGVAAVILSAKLPSIQSKTGKAKVNELGKVMKAAATKATSSGGGAGYTYLPKALKLSSVTTVPNAPVFDKAKGTYKSSSISVTIKAETGMKIYYSTNGKTPAYKNGVVTNGSLYTGAVTLSGAKSVTLKAIAVNTSGKASKVTSVTYTLQPTPTAVSVTSATGVTKVPIGGSVQLKAAVTPAYSVSSKVAWSIVSPNNLVTISNTGKVTVKKGANVGTYTVTAQAVGVDGKTYDGVEGKIEIEVTSEKKVQSIALATKTVTLTMKGDHPNYYLGTGIDVTYIDKTKGNVNDIYWSSSNTKVATVTRSGVVTAMGPGSATITALANDGSGKKATCSVKVSSQVSSLTISGPNKVAKTKSIALQATITPANATEKTIVWEVSPAGKGVKVSGGKVSADKTASGDYTITAKAMSKDKKTVTASKTYTVSVIDGAISSIVMPKNMTLFTTAGNTGAKTTGKLTPTVTGTTGFNSALIFYTSSAPGVVTVDQNGNLTAKAPGSATITCAATDGSGKKATCKVNVNIPMSKLTISPKGGMSYWIAEKKSVSYAATCGKEFGNPTNTKVDWTSSNTNVAKVDKNGKVTGVKAGTATITATAQDGSGVKATYSVKVSNPATYMYTYVEFVSRDYRNVYLDYDNDCPFIKVTVPNNHVGVHETQYFNLYKLSFDYTGRYRVKFTLLDGSNKSTTANISIW
ncbi:MAG: S8 family serine peptidase [Lachnospiraceae bacterium]|nr:S8 family serine peptidase [Lachnospiraceae bacterium]